MLRIKPLPSMVQRTRCPTAGSSTLPANLLLLVQPSRPSNRMPRSFTRRAIPSYSVVVWFVPLVATTLSLVPGTWPAPARASAVSRRRDRRPGRGGRGQPRR
jgi:hypothetical protein